jgi:hypothetical protein
MRLLVTGSLVNGGLGGKKYSKKVQKIFKYVQFTPSICIYKCMGFKIETHGPVIQVVNLRPLQAPSCGQGVKVKTLI